MRWKVPARKGEVIFDVKKKKSRQVYKDKEKEKCTAGHFHGL